MDELISKKSAIDAIRGWVNKDLDDWGNAETEIRCFNAIYPLIMALPSAQPELVAQGAYVRGFEQGRTQGMLDAKLQPTCNKLATDCISRQAAIDAIENTKEVAK